MPTYRSGALLGLFGDCYLKDTGMEGGNLEDAMCDVAECLRDLLKGSGGRGIGIEKRQAAIERACAVLER